ncbi:hypothetical protein [Paenibacillus silvisoli]|uniref:hypothetical protein n=1 Tax=Paenibacillus silvisoli TaxID=3110539 RepID=UPI00280495AB|nr:hypothetical protein [Paenibacillus silvisoli]
MPFKPIDFQMSVPRTPDNSSQQQQLNQRPIVEQTRLEHDSIKQTELQRSRNTAVEQSADNKIKDNRQRDSQGQGHSSRKKKEDDDAGAGGAESAQGQQKHPYKGKHIDISM